MNAQEQLNLNGLEVPKTLLEASQYFGDLDIAFRFMVAMRWGGLDKVACPRCGSVRVRFISTRQVWECKEEHAAKRFSVKTATIMEDSPLGLDKWLVAMWLLNNAKNGISSYELHRALGITQKSAWFMLHRIRLAMQTGSFSRKLGGDGSVVEADETFIGGKARNMHKDTRDRRIGKGTGSAGKTVVAGLLERKTDKTHSTVRLAVIRAASRANIHPLVKEHVAPLSELHTDALSAYTGLGTDFIHKFVDHAETYVKGNVHCNGMENFWSLLKRGISGTYVAVEPFHLFRYLDEQAFRFNNRKTDDAGRFLIGLHGIANKRLTYKALIGASERPSSSETEAGQA